ncbi:MAG UNVERIFIED_CONTAM: hypothetical protein LVQ98_05885 [Rickettsiaceae bacterium]|jgi:hypothetical protein
MIFVFFLPHFREPGRFLPIIDWKDKIINGIPKTLEIPGIGRGIKLGKDKITMRLANALRFILSLISPMVI